MRIQPLSLSFLWLLFSLLTFGVVSIANGQTSQDPVALPLKTAMAMAIRNNLDLRVDALDSSIAEASLQSNRGIYDPFVSVSANHGQTFYTGETYGTKDTTTYLAVTQYLSSGGSISASTQTGYTKPVSDFPDENWTDWYSSVGITFTQPLLRNFGKETRELGISLAANAHEGSIEQFRDSVIATVYDVIKGYNRLYTLQQVLEARQNALSSAQKLLTEIKKEKKSGANAMALANTEYTISQRLKDLVNAESSIRDQEAKLLYLIGVEKRIELNLVDLPSREEPNETEGQAIALAMENGSYLKRLRLDLKASELQERVAKRTLLPSLSLNTSVGFRGIEDTIGESFKQIGDGKGQWWSAGLQFSMSLGNSVAESNYRRNRLRTSQIKNRLAAAEWKLRDDIEEDLRSLISARVQMQVADKSVKYSEQRYEQYRKSVARKQSTVLDLLNVENDLVVARNSQTEALETFSNAVALLWKDAGVLLERKNINVNIAQPEELTVGTRELTEPAFTPTNIERQEAQPETPAFVAKPVLPPTKAQPIAATVTKLPQPAVPTQVSKAGVVKPAVYTLKIGEYVSSELEVARQKIKRAGLIPLVSTGSIQPRAVIRLRVGDYSSQLAAKTEMIKLRSANAEGFILNRGKAGYRLYAGSFFSRKGALNEQRRLVKFGIDLKLEETSALLPTSLLAAGRFSSLDAAQKEVVKLKMLGIESVVQKIG